jgi:3-hydroxy-3-methylglutaryl CoA synthase
MQMSLLFLGFAPLRGEKAVANWDEDTITMSVAAAQDCLKGENYGKVDGLYFASTSQTYALRQNAGVVAAALDLNTDTRTADFTIPPSRAPVHCWRPPSGSLNSCLVCAPTCVSARLLTRLHYGDGAAAFLIGKDDVIATISSYSPRMIL